MSRLILLASIVLVSCQLSLCRNLGEGEWEKVRIDVFYESFCSCCKTFLAYFLDPDFAAIESLVDLHLYPYGHAETIEKEGEITFHCQHGAKECRGNMLQVCMMEQAGCDYKRIMPMVQCIEDNNDDNIDQVMQTCASTFNFDFQQILTCATSSQGRNLMKKIGEDTNAFQPKIKEVPTVAYNGASCSQGGSFKCGPHCIDPSSNRFNPLKLIC